MSELEEIEQRIRKLPPDELAKFRAWFIEFDHLLWESADRSRLEGWKAR